MYPQAARNWATLCGSRLRSLRLPSPRLVFVHGWGDFDTHQGQAGRHGALLRQLDTGLAEFFSAVMAAGAAERTVVMTTSEFGHRAASTGSGADHGTPATQFLLGAAVSGGRFGEAPEFDRLDARGSLRHSVDLRSYYGSVLRGWLEAPPEEILGGTYEELPLF